MKSISAPVGRLQPNKKADVKTVQQLINGHIAQLAPIEKLDTDGVYGEKTEAAVLLFQHRVAGIVPDGIITAEGPTLKALNKPPITVPAPPAAAAARRRNWPAHVKAFIESSLPAARKVKAKWKVPIGATIAQSALETGWGRHVVGNAYFGIKSHGWAGENTSFGTTEVIDGRIVRITDSFRAYTDYEDAALDYGKFLTENARYKKAFQFPNDCVKFVQEVAKAGYATAPNYGEMLTKIIQTYNLTEYDE